MGYLAKVIEVLIASPSDVKDERDVITKAIRDWNTEHSKDYSIVFMPVRWETHANTEYDGYSTQEILNRQFVRECDVLIGAMRSKLGTPTRKSQSGTVEEIEEFISLNKPIKLYFSTEGHPDNVDTIELERLRKFKRDYANKGIYKDFNSKAELRDKVKSDLTAEARKFKSIEETIQAKSNYDSRKNLTYIFYASATHPSFSDIWHRLDSGHYALTYIANELSNSAVNHLLLCKENGSLKDITILGVYYNDSKNPKNGIVIKLTDIWKDEARVTFKFEYIRDTGIPSGLILKTLGSDFSYRCQNQNQFIVYIRRDIHSIIGDCSNYLNEYKVSTEREAVMKRSRY
ncbi:hypothetical protein [Brevibacillus sp. FIR094]|uniref:hypothetical protein n=1 Tax=Brevibacillus sp. FIR094 TaxID=3134809 RepID=UPI003D1DFEFA